MRKALKAIADFFVLIFMAYDRESVDKGLVDYSGQGRDKYGN